jgi:sugar transferase (PEP-CTERM/EpsH1 system associated)
LSKGEREVRVAKILVLAHRAPFPPDKGDKIRAFHILKHLARRHELWLGAGIDDPADLARQSEAGALCRDACLTPLGPLRRGVNMAGAAVSGAPLSVARFRHPRLARWIERVLREVRPDVVLVYSAALAQYVVGRLPPTTRLIVDFVDADAEKWRAYADLSDAPLRWVYAAEHRRLVRFERAASAAAEAAIFISETERDLFAAAVPEARGKLHVIPNGVDVDYFRPSAAPPPGGAEIVFCGRMDYAPNIEGAAWFAERILPRVRSRAPAARFRIVGAAPVVRVLKLAELPGVEVTGAVPDVRPHLAGAQVAVAPLRIARGIQNKVLEAMAAGRPVVATPQALDGIGARPGAEVLCAADEAGFAAAVCDVLGGRAPADLGARGRAYVLQNMQWSAKLAALDALLDGPTPGASAQAAA